VNDPHPTQDDDHPLPPGQALVGAPKVKHYGRIPRGDPQTWNMIFTAAGPDPDDATYPGHDRLPPTELGRVGVQELGTFEQSRVVADLHCASGWSAQDLAWGGVPASIMVERFPPPAGTVGVLVYAEYGYCANVRLSDLLRPTTLLALRLGDAALTPEHGFPVRLVVPHLYGHKSPKWFRGWEYLSTPRRGFWEERGYHLIGDPWTEQRYSYQE